MYVISVIIYLRKNRATFQADDLKWDWSRIIVGGVGILCCSFVLQITNYHPVVYAANIVMAAIIFYGVSIWAITRTKLFLPESASRPENSIALEALGKEIQKLLENDELFTDTKLTVSSVASRLKVQPYLISRAVNYYFQETFSEMLTRYRIRKAEELLRSDEIKIKTIEGIAFESGFNTMSAFYSSFKKLNKMTPTHFRNNLPIQNEASSSKSLDFDNFASENKH
jgi:AraC-like DNA-binding protein